MFRYLALIAALMLFAGPASAFCGFYVAKGDAKLFNKASKVVIARHLDRTVITMANDYQGDPSEFAMVIPTPSVLTREQINVGDPAVMDHIDAFTAPRLVEYFDKNPCVQRRMRALTMQSAVQEDSSGGPARNNSLGVTVEAEYTVGEYDIQILSARQSGGLATWLTENGYTLPDGAETVLSDYVGAGMKFFVARINLEEKAKSGVNYLRPLQIAFNSPDFMLPIRLGTLNADGEQELFVFTVTRQFRVESANYRTVKMPTDSELPAFVRSKFPDVYRALFAEQVRREPGVMFLEYAWNMSWCDPCAADPLSRGELRSLGAWWVQPDQTSAQPIPRPQPGVTPKPLPTPSRIMPRPQPVEAFVTRLHLRYDAMSHPFDLQFRETQDQSNYQARYVLRHPWTGEAQCPEASYYKQQLPLQQDARAQQLASLTGWPIGDIREQMSLPAEGPSDAWWKDIWK
jgi:hypothetical protein